MATRSAPQLSLVPTSSRRHCKAHRRIQVYVFMAVTEALSIAAGFAAAFVIQPLDGGISSLLSLLILLIPLQAITAFQLRAYGIVGLRSWTRGLRLALIALLIANALTLYLYENVGFDRWFLLLGLCFSAVLIITARQAAHRLTGWLLPNGLIETAILSDDPDLVAEPGSFVLDARRLGDAVALDDPQSLDRLARAVGRADRVLVACAPENRERWVRVLKGLGIDIDVRLPELDHLGVIHVDRHGDRLSACVGNSGLALSDRAMKRAFDLMAVLWFAPLLVLTFAMVSIAIKLDDGGPILFVQRRIGRGNQFFDLYKFRTMRLETLDGAGATSTGRADARVTRVGMILRRTSIDELPQLLNVLLGNMSIVGPRPHALGSTAENQLFWAVDPRYWLRHATKPGLTGLAQIRGFRGSTDTRSAIVNRIQADLEYLAGWSVWRDIRIVAATIGVLAHPNAY